MMSPSSEKVAGLASAIKLAVRATGKSINAVAKEAKVNQSILQRFVTGQRGLKLDTAERLCSHLGLELKPAGPAE
jgi:plasmid maintenance system antidote protein VapI